MPSDFFHDEQRDSRRLVLGIILAIIGVFIQAAPLMREDGRETPLFGRFRQKRYGTSHKTKEKSSEKDKGGTEESSKREGCKG